MAAPSPGEPPDEVMSTPATLPCSAFTTLVWRESMMSLLFTSCTAVTSVRLSWAML